MMDIRRVLPSPHQVWDGQGGAVTRDVVLWVEDGMHKIVQGAVQPDGAVTNTALRRVISATLSP